MAQAFITSKHPTSLPIPFKSLFDEAKGPLFEKSLPPDKEIIICQEVFFKISKKNQSKLVTLVLTDEHLYFPKVFIN